DTRIERLWVEVGTQFAHRWRAFFTCLEHLHRLDCSNPTHLWLLHYLFLDLLNMDCLAFRKEWNVHPLAGPSLHGQSPSDLRFLGETRQGKPIDEMTGVHPDLLHRYCRTYGESAENDPHQTGAGHPSDEEDETDGTIPDESSSSAAESDTEDTDESSALQRRIAMDLRSNVKHKPVHPPRHENPFDGQPAAIQAAFEAALVQVQM
ncbi:hypothetical protein JB92DRAFT_2700233, partial [Gautieria morchelliformis]